MMGLPTPSTPTSAWLEALREIIGPQAAHMRLPEHAPWQGALPALCERYGLRSGLGIGVRVGRAFARQMFPLWAREEGLQAPEVRLLPWPRRMTAGVPRVAAWAARAFHTDVQTRPVEGGLLWVAACPFGHVNAPPGLAACSPWVGLLEETLYWLSGGRWFAVRTAPHQEQALFLPYQPLH